MIVYNNYFVVWQYNITTIFTRIVISYIVFSGLSNPSPLNIKWPQSDSLVILNLFILGAHAGSSLIRGNELSLSRRFDSSTQSIFIEHFFGCSNESEPDLIDLVEYSEMIALYLFARHTLCGSVIS